MRASVECSVAPVDIWKHSRSTQKSSRSNRDEGSVSHGPPSKKARLIPSTNEKELTVTLIRQTSSLDPVAVDKAVPDCRLLADNVGSGELLGSSSSSAMTFVEEVSSVNCF